MKTRMLGSTGLAVTEIGLGCWALGGTSFRGGVPTGWAGADILQSLETVRAAWKSGIRFYDTTDAYGRGKSEVLVGMGLYDHKKNAIIATKVGNSLAAPDQDFSEPYIRGALDASLTRLAVDHIDLYQLHGPSLEAMTGELFDLMKDLKASGKIRAWGVSINSVEQGLRAIEGGAETIQLVYNILQQEIGRAIFPVARDKGVGIVIREALASGWLTGKFSTDTVFPSDDHRSRKFPDSHIKETAEKVKQLRFLLDEAESPAQAAIQYVLAEPAVCTVIVGCKTPNQIVENVKASAMTLSVSSFERIGELFG